MLHPRITYSWLEAGAQLGQSPTSPCGGRSFVSKVEVGFGRDQASVGIEEAKGDTAWDSPAGGRHYGAVERTR